MTEGVRCEDCGNCRLVIAPSRDAEEDEVVCADGRFRRGRWLRRDSRGDLRPRERFYRRHECEGYVARNVA
jgi:hypothetical protein